ncbi:MAG: hypothetical protein J3K34DRAFT_515962 [Monoraphidium minutum]|nr:MAG: hypothetical protein J3K34DRAFT_515962 [Monoraphidium minutum]
MMRSESSPRAGSLGAPRPASQLAAQSSSSSVPDAAAARKAPRPLAGMQLPVALSIMRIRSPRAGPDGPASPAGSSGRPGGSKPASPSARAGGGGGALGSPTYAGGRAAALQAKLLLRKQLAPTSPARGAPPSPTRPPPPSPIRGSPRTTPRGGAGEPAAAAPAAPGAAGGAAACGGYGGEAARPGGETAAVVVALHVRPMSAPEREAGCGMPMLVSPEGTEVAVEGEFKCDGFNFDAVFGAEAGGAASGGLYRRCVAPLVAGAFAGVNGTAFAYGQTGAGKSYTMGTDMARCQEALQEREGPAPRGSAGGGGGGWRPLIHEAVDDACARAAALRAGGEDVQMYCSFIEIHQDAIRDLLSAAPPPPDAPGAATSPSGQRGAFGGGGAAGAGAGAAAAGAPAGKLLQFRDPDPTKDIILLGLEEVKVSDRQQLLQCLLDGLRARATAATNANAHSSRSHAVFTIRVRRAARRAAGAGAPPAGGGLGGAPDGGQPQQGAAAAGVAAAASSAAYDYVEETLEARLHLVDLAGSERVGWQGVQGARLLEACSINQGLLALGNVIEALADKRKHVPYRDHVLTRLLRNALGGNSRTSMVACVSPADACLHDTLSTMRYASRARTITNTPVVNSARRRAEVASLRRENDGLRCRLAEMQTQMEQLAAAGAAGAAAGPHAARLAAQLAGAQSALLDALAALEQERAAGSTQAARAADLAVRLREEARERFSLVEAAAMLTKQLALARLDAAEARAHVRRLTAEAEAGAAERAAAAATAAAAAAAAPTSGGGSEGGRAPSKGGAGGQPGGAPAAGGAEPGALEAVAAAEEAMEEGLAALAATRGAAARRCAPAPAGGAPPQEQHEKEQEQEQAAARRPSGQLVRVSGAGLDADGGVLFCTARRRSAVLGAPDGGAARQRAPSMGGAKAAAREPGRPSTTSGGGGLVSRPSDAEGGDAAAGGWRGPSGPPSIDGDRRAESDALSAVVADVAEAAGPAAAPEYAVCLADLISNGGGSGPGRSPAARARSAARGLPPLAPAPARAGSRGRAVSGRLSGASSLASAPGGAVPPPAAPDAADQLQAWRAAAEGSAGGAAAVAAPWAAARRDVLRGHEAERLARLCAAAAEARGALEATPGSVLCPVHGAAAAAAAGAGYSPAAVAAAAAGVAAACEAAGGGGGGAARFAEWLVRVAAQQAELDAIIQAENAERRHLKKRANDAAAAAAAAAESAAAAAADGGAAAAAGGARGGRQGFGELVSFPVRPSDSDSEAGGAPGAARETAKAATPVAEARAARRAAEAARLGGAAAGLGAALGAASARLRALQGLQAQLDAAGIEDALLGPAAAPPPGGQGDIDAGRGGGKGLAAGAPLGEALWGEATRAAGGAPWRAFAALAAAAAAQRGRAEAARARAEGAGADAALQRRLAAAAAGEAAGMAAEGEELRGRAALCEEAQRDADASRAARDAAVARLAGARAALEGAEAEIGELTEQVCHLQQQLAGALCRRSPAGSRGPTPNPTPLSPGRQPGAAALRVASPFAAASGGAAFPSGHGRVPLPLLGGWDGAGGRGRWLLPLQVRESLNDFQDLDMMGATLRHI